MDVSGFNGDVALTGHGGEAFAFTFNVTQRKKDVGRYGGSRWNKKRGGILDVAGSVSVFLQMAVTGAAPSAFPQVGGTGDGFDPDGSALVLTAETGCTWTGAGIMDFNTTHRFDDPAIEGTFPFEGAGDWTEAWDETP